MEGGGYFAHGARRVPVRGAEFLPREHGQDLAVLGAAARRARPRSARRLASACSRSIPARCERSNCNPSTTTCCACCVRRAFHSPAAPFAATPWKCTSPATPTTIPRSTKLRELSQPVSGFAGTTGQRNIDISANGGTITLTPTDPAITERVRQAVDQSIQIIERRVNELGLVEPTIQREGTDRILVQVPGLQDPSRLKEILGKTAKLDFRMVDLSMTAEQAAQAHPTDSEILEGETPGQSYLIEKRVLVSGADLTDAQPGFDQRTNEPIVSFRFNSSGARKFAEATQANVGKPFAIVLDNKVISAPVIREPILGGSGQISGSFTVQ